GRGPAAVEHRGAVSQAHEPARPDHGAHAGGVGRGGPPAAATVRGGLSARHPGRAARDPGPLRAPAALRTARALRAPRARLPADLRPKEAAMQFVCFHLMPWPYLPADFEQRHDSAWLDLANTLDDPSRGHALYNEYLDQLVAAERLGFDVIGVNEHHQNAYGLMPSPNI